jgi:hypothetical protein
MRRLALLLSVAPFLSPLPAFAAERSVPYADMYGMFARVAQLQGGKYLKATATLSSADSAIQTQDITLEIRGRQGAIPVPIAADGTTQFPISDALLAENPPVFTNVPEGKLSMTVGIRVETPPQQRFRYGLMVEMQDEAKVMIAKQGMIARMLAPNFEGLRIVFPPGSKATATVESADGPERFQADAEGNVEIPDRRAWRRENPFVQLSEMPRSIGLGVD